MTDARKDSHMSENVLPGFSIRQSQKKMLLDGKQNSLTKLIYHSLHLNS